jgi:hypothetical protein
MIGVLTLVVGQPSLFGSFSAENVIMLKPLLAEIARCR